MKLMHALAILSAGLTAGGYGPTPEDFKAATGRKLFRDPKDRKCKNKFNLSPEEIELMKAMTPKEKKKFLKERR